MMAERMVAHFGTDILTIIEEQPERLIEVHGLGPRRTQRIADAWEEQKAIKEVMVFLAGVGVSTSLAVRIYKRYREDSIPVVRHEPYRLASEVWGIGFKTADTIAQAVGIPHDSPERIKAGLHYTLSQAADNGHCYLPEPDLVREAAKILEVDRELIDPCLDELVTDDGVVREHVPDGRDPAAGTIAAMYLVPFHRAERSLAGGLMELLALTSKVAVLTGGPGCGKSFTVRSVVTLATAKNATVILVAPTGRAAKRLAELTGHEACTVHRLLELQPGGDAKYDRDHPLNADLVVVDEASMMDVILANKLIKAIPEGAHLLLVGDVDQLPSVGAGEVLRDLLAADTIPRVRLTEIFRQAQQSGIVVNAHRINHAQPPQLTSFGDFYWFGCDPSEDSGLHPAEETAKLVVDIVAHRIPAKFGLDPVRDIQVLTPMHRGPAGAGNLNTLLQEALIPERDGTPEKRYGGRVFRVGDKVTQLRNNYHKGTAGIVNGTIAVVTSLSLQEQTFTVITDEDEQVDYDFAELDELAHATPSPSTAPKAANTPRRHTPHDLVLDDAPPLPPLHRRHPRQATHYPRRIPTRTRPSRPHPRSRPTSHRAHPPARPHRIAVVYMSTTAILPAHRPLTPMGELNHAYAEIRIAARTGRRSSRPGPRSTVRSAVPRRGRG